MSELQGGMRSISGPAAIAATQNQLEQHVQKIVQVAIRKHELRGDVTSVISGMHDSLAHVLDNLMREYGSDATNSAAEYAAVALEAGLIYPGQEVEEFMRDLTISIRATSRDIAKGNGSVGAD